ncbi:MAG: class I SAM-dependent methyltransferase [Gemmataceae bacterium]
MAQHPLHAPQRNGTPASSPSSLRPTANQKIVETPSRTEPRLSGGRVSAFDRFSLRKILEILGNPPLRLVLWNGEEMNPVSGQAVAAVIIRDRSVLLKILANPDVGFGDAYSAGLLDVDGDLIKFLETMYRTCSSRNGGVFRRLVSNWLYRPQANTLSGSRDNIHCHYDLSNDFYSLWLDDEMVYTCAYFPTPDISLEAAQKAKMDHVCRKLRLQPGQTVIEAGCGWGALARHMARHYGVTVRAFNISHEQMSYARARAKAEGLERRVEFIEDDYRSITGACDVFISVGMLEHVGPDNYRQLGEVIKRSLKSTGMGLIHSIGRNRRGPMNPWMEQRIFPGAYLPTLREMMKVFEPWNFSVLDVENLRLHYAKTLEHWLDRFDRHAEQIRRMFDDGFVRAWRLYLAGSLAGFTTGFIQLFQVVFAPGTSNAVPWTRQHIYAGQTET